jgi:hypothetical protein
MSSYQYCTVSYDRTGDNIQETALCDMTVPISKLLLSITDNIQEAYYCIPMVILQAIEYYFQDLFLLSETEYLPAISTVRCPMTVQETIFRKQHCVI